MTFIKVVKIFVSFTYKSGLKRGPMGSKTKSLGQILYKKKKNKRPHFFVIFIKLAQNVYFNKISVKFEAGSHIYLCMHATQKSFESNISV